MTNRTLFSVRASTPVSIGMRSRATNTWIPFEGTIRRADRPPASSRSRSVHAPAAPATCRARSTSGSRRSEERRVGKSVDLGGRRIIKKKKKTKKKNKRQTRKTIYEQTQSER